MKPFTTASKNITYLGINLTKNGREATKYYCEK